jgi:hypothetical protein
MPVRSIFACSILVLFFTELPSAVFADTINPNACLAAIVAPCYIANLTGPVLITNPSQVGFSITNTSSGGIQGAINFIGTATYMDANGDLAADPAAVQAQDQANTTALIASGTAPLAPNPGGAIVITNSTTSNISGFVDTPVTQRTDAYATTIEAVLNGGSTVYDQTFSAPFSDPSVQAAILQADGILGGDGATYGSPFQTVNTTVPAGSQVTYQVTGQSPTGAFEIGTITTFGPTSIAVGDNQSDLFTILAGQEDININTENFYATDRNAITTNAFLTSQTYEIDGTTSTSPAAPEPATWLFCGAGLLACLGRAGSRWARGRRAI